MTVMARLYLNLHLSRKSHSGSSAENNTDSFARFYLSLNLPGIFRPRLTLLVHDLSFVML
jgi:hypothetical protein